MPNNYSAYTCIQKYSGMISLGSNRERLWVSVSDDRAQRHCCHRRCLIAAAPDKSMAFGFTQYGQPRLAALAYWSGCFTHPHTKARMKITALKKTADRRVQAPWSWWQCDIATPDCDDKVTFHAHMLSICEPNIHVTVELRKPSRKSHSDHD